LKTSKEYLRTIRESREEEVYALCMDFFSLRREGRPEDFGRMDDDTDGGKRTGPRTGLCTDGRRAGSERCAPITETGARPLLIFREA